MQCLAAACAGCGICVSLCPANAITLEKEALTDSTSDSPALQQALVLYCENSAADAVKDFLTSPDDGISGKNAAGSGNSVEALVVPCGGLIDMERISNGLGAYDKIMAVVCPDDACRHFDGNKRACAQVKRLSGMLEAAGIPPERVRFTQVSQAMPGVLKDELREFLTN
jgi:coenzyme F420-reducing hydrogenase delta subunit